MTITQWIPTYLEHLRKDRALAKRTVEGYEQELRLFAGMVGEKTKIRHLTKEHVQAFLTRKRPQGKPPGPAARNRKLIVLRGFFGYLVDEGMLKRSPTAGVSWARVPNTERPMPTREDYSHLLVVLEQDPPSWMRVRDRVLIQTMFHTGIRVTEIANLLVGQVDFDGALLSGFRRKGGADHTLPLNREVLAELRAWMCTRSGLRTQTEHVFCSRTGKRLSVRQIERRLKALGLKAGIPVSVTPHALRHLHATELSNNNVNLEVVRRLMNHRSITTTSRYSHVGFDVLRTAVETLVKKED